MTQVNTTWEQIAGWRWLREWLLPVAAVALVFVMLVPLPAWVIDLLLATSITFSVLILLSALQVRNPVQFSVFPMLLLLMTLFRLSLNIATTRRILLYGHEGTTAAGSVIEAFGQFVVGGNFVVGFVLFLAIVAVQLLVVNHGAVRTAEVTARFSLDALPGKQMAIDADLNSGAIREEEARHRRLTVAREAEFHGAMDGAARFNQRDAVATLLITGVNIVAGLLIGVFQFGVPVAEALRTYTILTVGDGLVTIIPSLLIAVAAGVVLTRASSGQSAADDMGDQLFAASGPLWIAAGIMCALALIPGLPTFSFLLLAAGAAILARRAGRLEGSEAREADEGHEGAAGERLDSGAGLPASISTSSTPTVGAEDFESLMRLDEMSIEVGYALVPMVDEAHGGDLLGRIRGLRRELALQLGFLVPPIQITDNIRLKPREYVVRIRGAEVARWAMFEDRLLAVSADAAPPPLEGIGTIEPAFGSAAQWIAPDQQDQALAGGYTVVDQTSVLVTHLAEVVRVHAHELLTRGEVERLLSAVGRTHPRLVDELVPKSATLGDVQKVLQQLLREQVSIRDLPAILEGLLDEAHTGAGPVARVEAIRQRLGRSLVQPLLAGDGGLKVVVLDPELELEIGRAFAPDAPARPLAGLQPSFLQRILSSLKEMAGDSLSRISPVLLCHSPARYHLRRMLEPFVPRVVVLSPVEIPPVVAVEARGVLR